MNIALFESEIPKNIETEDEIIDSDIPEVDNQGSIKDEPENDNVEQPSKPPVTIDYSKYYVGILEIPKINLKRGFLDINSPYNNVDRNITVIQTSTYPDVDKGNFILAAHSGGSSVSFFTKLYNLVLGDLAYIDYKENRYTYKVVDIYTQPKVGMISIYRDSDKTTLTLVTCTRGSKTTQTIYILELINIE